MKIIRRLLATVIITALLCALPVCACAGAVAPGGDDAQSTADALLYDGAQPGVEIATERFTDKDRSAYEKMPAEKRRDVLQDVEKIVDMVRVGTPFAADQNLIAALLNANGQDGAQDPKIVAFDFEGRTVLDFPVALTIAIDGEIYLPEETVYVYRMTGKGSARACGKAEKIIEDDRVVGLRFFTREVSGFFTTVINLKTTDAEGKTISVAQSPRWIVPMLIGAGAILVIAAAIFILYRRKKAKYYKGYYKKKKK